MPPTANVPDLTTGPQMPSPQNQRDVCFGRRTPASVTEKGALPTAVRGYKWTLVMSEQIFRCRIKEFSSPTKSILRLGNQNEAARREEAQRG